VAASFEQMLLSGLEQPDQNQPVQEKK
jgi:hypothetical protein